MGEINYRMGLDVIDDVVTVPEARVRQAVVEILRGERMVVEGAGAVGVAALLEGKASGGSICVVLTGSNIDPELLLKLQMEFPPGNS